MEIVLVIVGFGVAYVLGYRRGRRVNSIVNMSARDLRRALRTKK